MAWYDAPAGGDAVAFDTLRSARRLREGGAEEPLAEAVVEVVVDATSELVTRDHFDQWATHFDERMTLHEQNLTSRMDARFEAFRAEMYRALAIQGGVILGGVGVIVALVETLN